MATTAATVRRLLHGAGANGRTAATDRELLRRFTADGDQAAFGEVVRRHTGMVLGVCRRTLPTAQDAEDACQATFLVLARKANAGRWGESVAHWLFATARNVARSARRAAERRARRERRAAAPESVSPIDRLTGRELLAALDEELGRQPPIYRDPLVLHYLEGLARDEVAARLGVPPGTVKIRLERGRKRLGAALARRGVGLGTGPLALAAAAPAGASPPRLVQAIRAAVAGKVPPAVAELAEGAGVNGAITKVGLGLLLATTVAGLGFGLGGPRTSTAGPPTDKAAPERAPTNSRVQPSADEVVVTGQVSGPDGRPVAGAAIRVVPWPGGNGTVDAPPGPVATDRDGRYDVRVPRAGFTDRRTGEEARPLVVATAPGHFPGWTATAADGHITLAAADAKVTGRLTDLEGRPVAGATVRVRAVFTPAGPTLDSWAAGLRRDRAGATSYGKVGPGISPEQLTGVPASAQTDAQGRFELPGYARDRVLHATVEGPGVATVRVGLVTRDLGPGGQPGPGGLTYYGSDGVITARPARLITGVVRDRTTGKPVAGVKVQSYVMAGQSHIVSGLVSTTTDGDGKFTLAGMPKGAGNKLLVVPGRGQPYLVRGVEVSDPDGVAPVGLEVALERGIRIEGTVRDAAGRPVPNVWVAYLANRFNDRVAGRHYGGNSDETEPTDADGKFRVVGLTGTGYLVAAAPGRNWLAATERTGSGSSDTSQLDTMSSPARADAFHAVYPLDVPSTATRARQDVVLEQGTSVTIAVADGDGKPVHGCRALGARPGDGWHTEFRPGDHRVEAVNPKQPRPVLFRHPERNLVGLWAPPVGAVRPTHRVVLRPGVSAIGRVVSDDVRPRAGVLVSIFVRPTPENSGDARRYRQPDEKIVTDADGRFRIPAVLPGFTYEVSVGGLFVDGSTFVLDAKAAGTKDLGDLKLKPGDE